MFFENLVLSWAQRYDNKDLSKIVLEDMNYRLPENEKLAELPETTKVILRCYIPHFLAERTER